MSRGLRLAHAQTMSVVMFSSFSSSLLCVRYLQFQYWYMMYAFSFFDYSPRTHFDFAALDIFQILRSPVAARFEALATVEVCELLACILTGDTDVESLLKLHQTCKILLFGSIVRLKDPDDDWI